MRATRYFDEQLRRKRPYLRDDWIEETLASPERRVAQLNDRIRCWRRVELDDLTAATRRRTREASILSRNRQFLYRTARHPSTETRAVTDTLNLDIDPAGGVVGIDINHASTQLDLTTLETSALPFQVLARL